MERKENNYEEYRLVSLGIPTVSEALPLLKYKNLIHQKLPKNYIKEGELIIPTDIGVDIGQSQDNTAFGIMFNKLVNGQVKRDYFHVSKHSFDLPAEMFLKKPMESILKKVIELSFEYPQIVERHIVL
ncbi:MAG: hypothetical protein GY830_03945 [Bacteroidetes bacterium]|nr:hypothetical protein [Bacteroidota bacterium]